MVLASELKRKKPGVVGISTVTDPYQPLEQTYRLTRFCLEQLLQTDFPVHIQTKSALVTRDIDFLRRFSDSQVMVSIGTLHDEERRLLEPGTSSIQDRFDALQKCANAGLKTAVFLGPIYPTLSINEIPKLLDSIKNAGAQEIWIDRFRFKPGILESIHKNLQKNQEIAQRFSTHLQKMNEYYSSLREELVKQGRKRNLRIIDAF